jgi:hypothetical protein
MTPVAFDIATNRPKKSDEKFSRHRRTMVKDDDDAVNRAPFAHGFFVSSRP